LHTTQKQSYEYTDRKNLKPPLHTRDLHKHRQVKALRYADADVTKGWVAP